jgi:Dyp-type peroxidase family
MLRTCCLGAPIDLTPLRDDTTLANDESRNNNFFFTRQNPDDQVSQERCPFAAHIRKSNPRGDLAKFGGTTVRRIIRRGIQYGEELTHQELQEGRTIEDRGLLFVCYQSNIENGFQFIQQSRCPRIHASICTDTISGWVNEPSFPPKSIAPGLDALIGQPSPLNNEAVRQLTGTNPRNPNNELPFGQWVFPNGGEYFFSPSISALKQVFALGS